MEIYTRSATGIFQGINATYNAYHDRQPKEPPKFPQSPCIENMQCEGNWTIIRRGEEGGRVEKGSHLPKPSKIGRIAIVGGIGSRPGTFPQPVAKMPQAATAADMVIAVSVANTTHTVCSFTLANGQGGSQRKERTTHRL